MVLFFYFDDYYLFFCCGVFSFFAEGGKGSPKSSSLSPYEEAMEALSSLITRRTRADDSNVGDQFSLLYDYLKVKKFVNWAIFDEILTMVCIMHCVIL